jgi:hypothetical protein
MRRELDWVAVVWLMARLRGSGVSPSVGMTRLTHAGHTEETAKRETAARVPAGLIAPEVTIDRVFYRRLTRGAVHVRGAGVPT